MASKLKSEGIVLTAQITNAMLSSTGTDAGGAGSMLSMIIPLVLLIAVFYFLLIRPENKKKKAAAKMRSELSVGDQITTIGGIVGTICAVKENTIVIETSSDRVRMEFTKWAVSTKGAQTSEDAAPAKEEKEKK